jgi:hypothetical protein
MFTGNRNFDTLLRMNDYKLERIEQQAERIEALETALGDARAWSALWKRAYKTLWLDWSHYTPRDQRLTVVIEKEDALGGDS